jgi:hypothetical protein
VRAAHGGHDARNTHHANLQQQQQVDVC